MKLIKDFGIIDEFSKIKFVKYPYHITKYNSVYDEYFTPDTIWDIFSLTLTGNSYITVRFKNTKFGFTFFENDDFEAYELTPEKNPEYFL